MGQALLFLLGLIVSLGWPFMLFYSVYRSNQKREIERYNALKELSDSSKKQMADMLQAFDNVMKRKGGQPKGMDELGGTVYDKVITQEELMTEYAKIVGARGCPCAGCLKIQKEQEKV